MTKLRTALYSHAKSSKFLQFPDTRRVAHCLPYHCWCLRHGCSSLWPACQWRKTGKTLLFIYFKNGHNILKVIERFVSDRICATYFFWLLFFFIYHFKLLPNILPLCRSGQMQMLAFWILSQLQEKAPGLAPVETYSEGSRWS